MGRKSWEGCGRAHPSARAGHGWLPPLVLGLASIVLLFAATACTPSADSASDPAGRDSVPQQETFTAETLIAEARDIAARVVEAYPEDPDSHALMGRLYQLFGETREARMSWERCLELDPQRADIHRALAEAAWDEGDFETTVVACRQALEIAPSMNGVRLRLGRSLLELGRTEEAIAVLEQAVSLSGSGHFYLAQAYMQSEAYAKARDSYLRAVQKHPDNAQAYYGLALASVRLGEPEKAQEYQETFRELGVEDAETVRARKREAEQLNSVARERSIAATACARAADVHRRHGDLQQAERLWQRAAVIDAKSASRQDLFILYDQSGRLEEAQAFFEELTRIHPESSLDQFYLGNICARLDRREEAEQAYLAVTRLAPDEPEGFEALGRLYLSNEWKVSEAKAPAARAAELGPSPRTYLLLARVYRKIGEHENALAALEKALEMDPDNVESRQLHEELRNAE